MFKHPFLFDGRIRRTEYVISFVMYMVCYFVILHFIERGGSLEVLIAYAVLVPLVWFLWAQGAKRCHDLGKSGWFQVIPFYFLWLLFAPGVPQQNEFDVNAKLPVSTKENTPDGAPPQQSHPSRS